MCSSPYRWGWPVGLVKNTREAWVERAAEVVAERGPDAVGVEGVARDLGVTKGGFYGYFENRRALLAAVLDAWEQGATKAVADQVDELDLEPGQGAFQASQLTWGGDPMNRMDLAVREWARRDAEVAQRLARVDTYRLDYLRSRMRQLSADDREAEVRTVLAYSAAIGMRYAGTVLDEQARQDAIRLLTTPGPLGLQNHPEGAGSSGPER